MNGWQVVLREWARDLGATHVMVDGCGPRRRLAVGSVPGAIKRVHGDQAYDAYTNSHSPHRCVVYSPDGHLAAHLSEPASRIQVGVILPAGKPDYQYEPIERTA